MTKKVKTLTRIDLADALYRELGFSHAEAFKLIDEMLKEIVAALGRGESVKLSRFASFIPKKKKSRMGRNPKNGVPHEITPRTVVSFHAALQFKKAFLKKAEKK